MVAHITVEDTTQCMFVGPWNRSKVSDEHMLTWHAPKELAVQADEGGEGMLTDRVGVQSSC